MYIWLEGVFGTGGCLGLPFAPGEPGEAVAAFSGVDLISVARRFTASGRAARIGGGKGEIDMQETLAE